MTSWQRTVKYIAIAIAVFLIATIVGTVAGAFGVIGGFFGSDNVADELKSFTVSQNIVSLKVEIGAADFTIKSGDSFAVESNLENITVNERDGVLIITEPESFFGNYNNAKLVLYIPADFCFDTVDITTGAGRLTVDELYANELKLELGAGEVVIESLNVHSETEIESGAGELKIKNGTLKDLDLDMGIGDIKISAELLGSSELNFGIGDAEICLAGSVDSYRFKVNKGIGSVEIDGNSMSNDSTFGNGENKISVSGGIGSVNITFED